MSLNCFHWVLLLYAFSCCEFAYADKWEVIEVADSFDGSYECSVKYKHGIGKAISAGLQGSAGGSSEILYPVFINKDDEKWMSMIGSYGVQKTNIQIKIGAHEVIRFEGLQLESRAAGPSQYDMTANIDFEFLAKQGVDVEAMKQQLAATSALLSATANTAYGAVWGGSRAYGDQLNKIIEEMLQSKTFQMRNSYSFGGNEYSITDEFEVDNSLANGLRQCGFLSL